MKEVKTIIVCSDFSAASDHALARATMIAAQLGARCEVVHAVDFQPMLGLDAAAFPPESLQEQVRYNLQQSLADQIARCSFAGLPVASAVIDGGPVAALPDYAKERHADLVVLGATGAGFLERIFLGTTATRVIKRLAITTLVVRREPKKAYQKVLVPIDFSNYAKKTLQAVRAITPESKMVILHAFESVYEGQMVHAGVDESTIHRFRLAAREDANQRIRGLMDELGLGLDDCTVSLVRGSAYKEILSAESASDVDLIALGKQGRGFVNELLLGSVTKHVLLESKSDVLIQPQN